MFRRAFLARMPFAATLMPSPQQPAPAAAPPAERPAPMRHAQDDWLDHAPTKHRTVFDMWMADKVGETVGFAGNWIRINKDEYGLADGDIALVLIARHGAAPFAFNDAIWTKYGRIFAANMSANDKVAHPNPTTNTYATRIANLSKQGLRLAICSLTMGSYVRTIAQETGQEREAVDKELRANGIGSAQFVPAGIVTVTRAQERGYALVSIG
jgi:intracellular sulfur oxidation DsrE/DsrF family protein